MTLKELKIGKTAIIRSVGGSGALRQHFLDMGLIQGTEVTVVKYAPMGDPIELKLHGYELTIRLDDAEKIQVEEIHRTSEGEEAGAQKIKHGSTPSRIWRRRKIPFKRAGKSPSGERNPYLCACGKPKLRKDHACLIS